MTQVIVTPRANDEILKAAVGLDNLSYDQQRESLAKEMGVRVATLDTERKKALKEPAENEASSLVLNTPEPWPDSVNGVELLNGLVDTFNEYLVLPEGASEAMALWTLHTYCHDAAWISPLLVFSSPTKQCGKTTCLTLLGSVVDKPLPSSNLTAPVIFRGVEEYKPTLLLDEADTYLKDDVAMKGVLNSGHNRAQATALRLVGDDHSLKRFSTWCPKTVAAIGKLPATLMDRGVVILMQRKKKTDNVRRLRGDRLHEFEPLRQQCARWAADNLDAIKATDPNIPEYLGDRARDNWRTLLAIAEIAGWTEATLTAIRQLTPEKTEDDDYSVKLLADIKEIFKNDGRDRMPSADIVEALNEMEESPWPAFLHGKGISPQRMANMLGKYKIKPYVQRIEGSQKTLRGYKKEDFIEIWSLYLTDSYDPPNLDVTVQQRSNGGASSDFTDVTSKMNVTPGNGLEPPSNGECYAVTPENRDIGHVSALEDDSERLRGLEAEYQDMPKDYEGSTESVVLPLTLNSPFVTNSESIGNWAEYEQLSRAGKAP